MPLELGNMNAQQVTSSQLGGHLPLSDTPAHRKFTGGSRLSGIGPGEGLVPSPTSPDRASPELTTKQRNVRHQSAASRREKFPYSDFKCGLRPLRTHPGPVRSTLRCGRPARRRRTAESPATENKEVLIGSPGLKLILTGSRPSKIRLHVNPDRRRSSDRPACCCLGQSSDLLNRLIGWCDQREVDVLGSHPVRTRPVDQRVGQFLATGRVGQPPRRRVHQCQPLHRR